MRGRASLIGAFAALVALAPPGYAAAPAKAPPKPAYLPQRGYLVYAKERYDSLLSLNEHCPVKHGKLNPKIRPTYINRQPVGFC